MTEVMGFLIHRSDLLSSAEPGSGLLSARAMQSIDGGIRAWFRGRCDVYDYPQWWLKPA
ncbi:MAG: hypothetical protein NTY03_10780 [Candidatus Bathyarchaeota archaeon]|nr:hypothetical protein [Candidatus Bathyarchaeota archaeon]